MAAAVASHSGGVESVSALDSIAKSVLWTMRDEDQVEIRQIHQGDEERMIQFHQGLSERSVYMRYFQSLSLAARTAHTRLARICYVDPESETVLVALEHDQKSDEQNIVAVGRLSKLPDSSKAEVALLVMDEFQGCGIGTELLHQLIQAAQSQNITQIEAEMLRDNIVMQKVLKKFAFHLRLIDARSVRAVLKI